MVLVNPDYNRKIHGVLYFSIAIVTISLLALSFSFLNASTLHHHTIAAEVNAMNTSTVVYNSNSSNAPLGSLFLTGEDRLTNFSRINETYTEISYLGNRTMPPEGEMINAIETGNLTIRLHSNGIAFVEGQSILVSKGGFSNNGSSTGQENATAMLVDLNGIRPDDPRSSTGVAFFSTNSTGQLAFLDNLVAIYQVSASPAGTAITYWEWKGADLPFR
jgi:hypothetical protein